MPGQIRLDPEKFSELPVANNVDGTELIPIVKDGENMAVPIGTVWHDQDLSEYAQAVGFHKITVSPTAPANPQVGDLWVDTN